MKLILSGHGSSVIPPWSGKDLDLTFQVLEGSQQTIVESVHLLARLKKKTNANCFVRQFVMVFRLIKLRFRVVSDIDTQMIFPYMHVWCFKMVNLGIHIVIRWWTKYVPFGINFGSQSCGFKISCPN